MIVKEEIKVDENGQLIEGKIATIKKVNAEQFVQVYLQNSDDFYCLSKAEANVLGICWYMSQYYGENSGLPGNIVQYNGILLKALKDKTKLSESSIKHAFMSLCKKEMFIKGETRGIYYLNPRFFFKGKISDRMKALEVTVKYLIEQQS